MSKRNGFNRPLAHGMHLNMSGLFQQINGFQPPFGAWDASLIENAKETGSITFQPPCGAQDASIADIINACDGKLVSTAVRRAGCIRSTFRLSASLSIVSTAVRRAGCIYKE